VREALSLIERVRSVARNDIITGLDIGTTKICALVAEVTEHGETIIIGVGMVPSLGMKRGMVVDIDATAHAIEEAVSKAAQQAGRDVDEVYVGVTGEHISSLNSNGRIAITQPDREITRSDVDRVLEAARVIVLPPDRHILHAIARSYSIDGQNGIRQPVGMNGHRLEVQTHIVHGSTTCLQNIEKCVTRADLEVVEQVLEPLATGEAVLYADEKEMGVCLIDIGGGTTDLAIFVGGEIYYSAVIPVGGNHVTSDVAYGLTVGHDEAERLKTESGVALTSMVADEDVIQVRQVGRDESRRLRRRALVEIIEPRMQELFEMVYAELERADCLNRIPAGLVISGGGSQLKGCTEVAQQQLRRPVRIGKPHGIGSLPEDLQDPRFATAVGLVLYGARQLRANQRTRSTRNGSTGPTWLRSILRWFHSIFSSSE